MSQGARRIFSLALVCGLLSLYAWADEPPDQKEGEEASHRRAPDREIVKQADVSATQDEKVILSPWRVGDAKGEKRKEESKKRKERVLRKAEKKKRDLERRKRQAEARAKRVKRQTNPLYPTIY